MVQYSVWPNCQNSCKFCLRKDRSIYTLEQQLENIEIIKQNIQNIDWNDEYKYGISLLGGELFNITDVNLRSAFKSLINSIINIVFKDNKCEFKRFSTVTNGIYDPQFLIEVLDIFNSTIGIKYVDINFSYDIKYRYRSLSDENLTLSNINLVHTKYDYNVGVQMILTQYLIDSIFEKKFDIDEFIKYKIPGNTLTFLYPHPINTGINLRDFFFSRKSFLNFIITLMNTHYTIYRNFAYSTLNSAQFKYTGLSNKKRKYLYDDKYQLPILTDGKEQINIKCGHSILYQCYSDSDKCILCDLLELEGDIRK